MESSLDRWEKDPFFSAAEEVQESADRMQSTVQTWVHAKKDLSDKWKLVELQRDVRTVRQYQMEALEGGEVSPSWVRLHKGECNEFASFLAGQLASAAASTRVREDENHQISCKSSLLENPKNSSERASVDSPEENLHGHRKAASASTEIGAWSIAIIDDGYQRNSSNGHSATPPRKIPSLSGCLNAMDPVSEFKWSEKGFRKWKPLDADCALLKSSQPDRGINACFERSKSYLDSCNASYNEHFYGWYGTIQGQIQSSNHTNAQFKLEQRYMTLHRQKASEIGWKF